MDLDISPSAQNASAKIYPEVQRWKVSEEKTPLSSVFELSIADNFFTCRAQASSVSMKNRPLKTSFRSTTHATDSARSGWMPNTAAANAARQQAPVNSRRARNSRMVVAA